MGGQRLGETWWIDLTFWIVVMPILIQGVYAVFKTYCACRWVYCSLTKKAARAEMKIAEKDFPMVTVQICCYNEYAVIKRTMDAAASIDWPAEKFEVLVCDDSTDDTKGLVDDVAADWQERGINVRVLRRGTDRTGYKAGILAFSQPYIQHSEFILMLDADHIADPNVLRRGMGHFYSKDGMSQDLKIGLVQFPWSYYNLGKSILTECDALLLDVAFVIEQKCRGQMLGFFGFNGTGGIWRKAAIEAGGGWSWDTITEDLDLSYKAHINGDYKFVFVEDTPMALEVPPTVAAYKSQKYRWAKGFAQVFRKSFVEFMRMKNASLELKFECIFHLTGAMQYVLGLWALVWWPILRYLNMAPNWLVWLFLMPLVPFVLVGCIGIFGKAPFGKYTTVWQRIGRLRFLFPAMVLACGMSLNEGYAFLNGLFSKDATFVRTPKEGKTDEDTASGTADDEDDEDEEIQQQQQQQQQQQEQHAAAAPVKKKPKYKAQRSLTWILELLIASYFLLVFVYFSTVKNSGRNWRSPGNIVSVGYLIPFLGFFLVGGTEPYNMFRTFLRRCRKARSRSRQAAASTAAVTAAVAVKAPALDVSGSPTAEIRSSNCSSSISVNSLGEQGEAVGIEMNEEAAATGVALIA